MENQIKGSAPKLVRSSNASATRQPVRPSGRGRHHRADFRESRALSIFSLQKDQKTFGPQCCGTCRILYPWARRGSNFPRRHIRALQHLVAHTFLGASCKIPGLQTKASFFLFFFAEAYVPKLPMIPAICHPFRYHKYDNLCDAGRSWSTLRGTFMTAQAQREITHLNPVNVVFPASFRQPGKFSCILSVHNGHFLLKWTVILTQYGRDRNKKCKGEE